MINIKFKTCKLFIGLLNLLKVSLMCYRCTFNSYL